jgi:glutaredoxin 3
MAKSYLAQKEVQFTEYDVSVNHEAAREMVDISGQMGVPVISVGGQLIIGFNRARLDQLLAEGASHVSLGITIADAARIITVAGNNTGAGAYIGSVKPGSLGEKLGLNSGDIIIKLASMPVVGAADIERLMATLKNGDRLAVSFLRNGTESSSETII